MRTNRDRDNIVHSINYRALAMWRSTDGEKYSSLIRQAGGQPRPNVCATGTLNPINPTGKGLAGLKQVVLHDLRGLFETG